MSNLFHIEQISFFLFGLVFGSFANVCIYRWPREESIMTSRSKCPHCGRKISWYDNIPVLSYIFLLGRCRICNGPISLQYPVVELITGISFLISSICFAQPQSIIASIFLWALIVSFAIDLEFRILPDEINIPFTIAGILISLTMPLYDYLKITSLLPFEFSSSHPITVINFAVSLSGMILGAGIILIIRITGNYIYKQEAMGLGDVKFMAFAGTWLGPFGALQTIFAGAILGGIVSIFLVLFKKVDRRSYIPFGPFLALGAVYALFN